MPKARNLYLAKCASEGKQKALALIVAALNYFCGPLCGVDKDIQASILQAEKRTTPPTQHRSKIDTPSMRKLILQGSSATDPKVTQAATLALLQFKAFLRISEARNLRVRDLECVIYAVTLQHTPHTLRYFRLGLPTPYLISFMCLNILFLCSQYISQMFLMYIISFVTVSPLSH
ncbi:hypothetical protein Y032_0058g2914 [Ancylostoma ceylanicum]|nr:hypothetical protein Y032_0058g2914 [Ancylostoma ceylanicum]